MQVNDKIMYHFHNGRDYNEIWVPNNEIIVDDNFETNYLSVLKYFHTSVIFNDNAVSFYKVLDNLLKKEQDTNTYIKLLEESKHILLGINIFKRELALEEVRKEKFPDLPSRKHVIWLCDKKQLNFWEKELKADNVSKLDLFKVSITGNLFKTSDEFIPDDHTNYESNLKEAEKYWNPIFENEEQEAKAEYIFQGKVKVLEKIK